ncbi:unnamed protein product [Amoebophrya sp. A120]|nr:unnamed protein product [Amoebophrya sp. A120]|eukprot:GSA120T00007255001.1
MGGLSELDVAELEQLVEHAKRPLVKDFLTSQIQQSKAQIEKTRPKPVVLDDDTGAMDVLKTHGEASAAPAGASASSDANLKWTEVSIYEMKKGGGYNDKEVVVDLRLKGVENLPAENITTEFTRMSLDVKVKNLDGVNYRFRRTALQHDIVAAKSSHSVKKNHVLITMQKVEGGTMGYETWTDVGGRRKREDEKQANKGKAADATGGIMSMMKDMYDEGDDSMKRIIGEAMSKAYQPGGPKQSDIDNIGKFDMPGDDMM